MIKKKTKFALIMMAIFIIPCTLSACGKANNEQINSSNLDGMVPPNNDIVKDQEMMNEEVLPSDKIEFSDPGNDEIGNDVKEMDALLNQTTPSEYDEEDLSDSAVEDEVELK